MYKPTICSFQVEQCSERSELIQLSIKCKVAKDSDVRGRIATSGILKQVQDAECKTGGNRQKFLYENSFDQLLLDVYVADIA
jgi:hypothetical protein